MKTHKLKTWPPFFDAIEKGEKNFELRKNDRDFKVGDKLELQEWSEGCYSGRVITAWISYILSDPAFGTQPGYAVLALQDVEVT